MRVITKVYLLLFVTTIFVLAINLVNILTFRISPTGVFLSGIGFTLILTGWYQLHIKNEIIEYLKESSKDVKLYSLNVYLTVYTIIGCIFLLIGISKIFEFIVKK